jgi:hypothetical protein
VSPPSTVLNGLSLSVNESFLCRTQRRTSGALYVAQIQETSNRSECLRVPQFCYKSYCSKFFVICCAYGPTTVSQLQRLWHANRRNVIKQGETGEVVVTELVLCLRVTGSFPKIRNWMPPKYKWGALPLSSPAMYKHVGDLEGLRITTSQSGFNDNQPRWSDSATWHQVAARVSTSVGLAAEL